METLEQQAAAEKQRQQDEESGARQAQRQAAEEADALRGRLAAAEKERDTLAAERDSLKQALEKAREASDEASKQEAAVSALEKQKAQLAGTVDSLEAQLSAAKVAAAAPTKPTSPRAAPPAGGKAMGGLFSRTLSRSASQKHQQAQAEAESSAVRSLESKLASAGEACAAAEAARDGLEKANQALEAEAQELRNTVAALEAKLAEAPPAAQASGVERSGSDASRPQQGDESVTSSAGKAASSSAESVRDAGAPQDEGAAAAEAERVRELRGQLEAAEQAAERAEERLRREHAAAAAAVQQADAEAGALRREAAGAGRKLAAAEGRLADAEERLAEQEEAHGHLFVLLEAAHGERDALSVQLAAREAELGALRSAGPANGHAVADRAGAELAAAAAARGELQRQLAEAAEGRRAADEEAGRLQQRLAAAEAQLQPGQRLPPQGAQAAAEPAAPAAPSAMARAASVPVQARLERLARRRSGMDGNARPLRPSVALEPEQAQEPNQALRARVAQLEAELAAAQEQKSNLAACLDRFQSLSPAPDLAARGGAPPLPAPQRAQQADSHAGARQREAPAPERAAAAGEAVAVPEAQQAMAQSARGAPVVERCSPAQKPNEAVNGAQAAPAGDAEVRHLFGAAVPVCICVTINREALAAGYRPCTIYNKRAG